MALLWGSLLCVCVCMHLCSGAEVTILQSVLVSPVAGHIYFK